MELVGIFIEGFIIDDFLMCVEINFVLDVNFWLLEFSVDWLNDEGKLLDWIVIFFEFDDIFLNIFCCDEKVEFVVKYSIFVWDVLCFVIWGCKCIGWVVCCEWVLEL